MCNNQQINTAQDEEYNVLARILDEVIKQVDPDIAEAIRLCAIPRWFNENIVSWLRGEHSVSKRTEEIVNNLINLTFVILYRNQNLTYHEMVRNLLVNQMYQKNIDYYRKLHLRMAEYYKKENKSDMIEYIYHLMAGGDSDGFELLKQEIHKAIHDFRYSTAEYLLNLSKEPCILLSEKQHNCLESYKIEFGRKTIGLWLNIMGFRTNPFAIIDSQHDPYIEEYFVEPLGFEELISMNSTCYYAPQGGGKTACRKMIEYCCKRGDIAEKTFTVTLDDYKTILEQSDISTKYVIETILKNVGYVSPFINQLSPSEMLDNFFSSIKSAGFNTMFILIDNIEKLDVNFQNILLKAFADILSLTNIQGVFFKFFLPLEIKQFIDRYDIFPVDKIKKTVVSEWYGSKLLEVLRARLVSATKIRLAITSLDFISELQLRGRIDNEIVKYSNTPRDLVQLVNDIFVECNEKDQYSITIQIFESVLNRREHNVNISTE